MFTPIRQLEVAVSGTASTPLKTHNSSQTLIYRLYSTVDCVVKLSNSSTDTADRTVTSGAYVSRNFILPAGVVETFQFQSNQAGDHVSAVALDGSSTGKLYVTTGIEA